MYGVGAAAGVTEAVGAGVVTVAVIGASRSGSVIVVSWEVFMPETSKSELASGDTDLRPPAVGWDADGSSYAAVSISPSRVLCRKVMLHLWGEGEDGYEPRTSSVVCTICCSPVPAAEATAAAAALAPGAGTAPAASSEHSFLTAGCKAAASSSGLFLGLASFDAGLRGEGLARRDRLRLASRLVLFSGLAASLGDLGDIWTLASSEPRTRRLVGVAVALILGAAFGVCRNATWEVDSPPRDGPVQGASQGQ